MVISVDILPRHIFNRGEHLARRRFRGWFGWAANKAGDTKSLDEIEYSEIASVIQHCNIAGEIPVRQP